MISAKRETREVGGRTDHDSESLVPSDRNLSAELRHNPEVRIRNLYLAGLVGGGQSIRTPETFLILQGKFVCAAQIRSFESNATGFDKFSGLRRAPLLALKSGFMIPFSQVNFWAR
jgi:hypothetical protein